VSQQAWEWRRLERSPHTARKSWVQRGIWLRLKRRLSRCGKACVLQRSIRGAYGLNWVATWTRVSFKRCWTRQTIQRVSSDPFATDVGRRQCSVLQCVLRSLIPLRTSPCFIQIDVCRRERDRSC